MAAARSRRADSTDSSSQAAASGSVPEADLVVCLSAPDQVSQVRGDRTDRIAGRAAQGGLSGKRGRVGEQHAIGGSRVLCSRVVRGPGEDVGEQPGR